MIISHVDITVYIAYFYIDINDYSGVKVSQCEYAKVLMSCRVTVGRDPRIDSGFILYHPHWDVCSSD